MASAKEITDILESPTDADRALIEHAYEYAEKAHKDHKRFSGEPYFTHLFETAKTLAELKMDSSTIAAGLLHDSIEDVNVKETDFEKEFGKEILFLVQGVTKLGKLKYHGAVRHNESLRKLFVAMSEDIRVLIIKLCDRLHNIKTLEFVPKNKQERIASETLEIFAPLAYRLGMRKLSRELEDLSFAFVSPADYKEVKEILKKKSKENIHHLIKFHKSVIKALTKNGLLNFRTNYRIKGLYSLFKKYKRKNKDLEKIYDISALRIIVSTVSDCYKALGVLHGVWRPLPGRIKDYIAFPKPNGYQSLHTTIFMGDGGIIEVQIKTEEMYKDAEYGIASHLSYKDDFKKKTLNPNLLWIKRLLPGLTAKVTNTKQGTGSIGSVPEWIKELAEYPTNPNNQEKFIENLKADFFSERIFVFTPKGDVVDLPKESSVIDFAYAIHSDIGSHIAGARVNGKLVSLDSSLRNGDIVEITTKETSHPTRKWLEFAKSTMAQKHIRQSLSQEEKKQEPIKKEAKKKPTREKQIRGRRKTK